MSRVGLQKSVRLFHKFSEETARRRGGNQAGREGIAHLAALAEVLKGEQPFTPSLLEPLSAFTNLLQSAQLPPDFGNYSFGDALLAIEEAMAERRQHEPQHWEFEGEVTDEAAALVSRFREEEARLQSAEHEQKLSRFVGNAAGAVEPRSLLVVGALAEPQLPLAALCRRFESVVLGDVDVSRLEERVRRDVPDSLRARVTLERYDLSGCAATFDRAVESRVARAKGQADAEQALVDLLRSYDVSSGSAGLSAKVDDPDLVISAMVLAGLGLGFRARVAHHLGQRGFAVSPTVEAELDLFSVWLEQHHVQALLRRAKSAVLVSEVSRVPLRLGPGGKKTAVGEPHDLLGVERLVERLPEVAEPRAELSWEVESPHPSSQQDRSLSLVEAVFL